MKASSQIIVFFNVNLSTYLSSERRPKNDSNTERPGVWSKLWNYVTGNRKQTGDNRIIKPTPNPAYNESWHVADWSQVCLHVEGSLSHIISLESQS